MNNVKQYRKKPVVIEAVLLDVENINEVAEWCGATFYTPDKLADVALDITTLEGVMRANLGDYIIKGVANEFYPCKPDIFAATYEAALPSQQSETTS